MVEAMLIIITPLVIMNTVLLLKLIGVKSNTNPIDSKLYDEQIKNYKRILRLNERYIKEIKSKGEQSYEQSMVQPQEQRRVY